MTSASFVFLLIIFSSSLYLIEKRPLKLVLIDKLDQKKFPFVMIVSVFIIGGLGLTGAMLSVLRLFCGAGTIFCASYLVVRYRQGIDRRMKR
ncbi:hypothetical protein [Vagococcus salmoninarum]|uniref:hypothetical protein n=1 Tax=Vagococcus salmoninarum TaxID=2739 RepID=UPI0028D3AC60|nr:hypothetical protein [Vagococcus salmoninarum]